MEVWVLQYGRRIPKQDGGDVPVQLISLLETRVGTPQRIGGPEPVWSSIHKRPLVDPIAYLTPLGLGGDTITHTAEVENSGRSRHGGYRRAVYAFPWQRHEPMLRATVGTIGITGRSLGENLRVAGADERSVHIGDKWEWGEALLEVTGPRVPGWILQAYFGGLSIGQVIIRHGMCGWFLQVLRPGPVPIMGTIKVVERNTAQPTIAEVFYRRVASRADNR